MKQKYPDFNKLNRLLVACFEAEKLYYNAAEDAQTTELKRFLNFMAVERNRMANTISSELSSRDIEPLKLDSEKGHQDRTWEEIKEALEHFNSEIIIKQCIARDLNNIKRYDELINNHQLPEITLGILYKQKQQLEWYIKQAEAHKTNPTLKSPNNRDEALHGTPPPKEQEKKRDEQGRIINLKAM
ncbi:DUF2383 domain-containing protein [Marinirhabdus gelatinilytica]|uniref:Uncharacterized protein (TIGR02284 family) n=1 Tax=Marinirhabdus gelatinilytica TaxID=1703343 RepID=A0A370Q8T0_9FLAO|nr:DUF2383 domain-containing protein [Marinirhabdus gelatinilytica]RDK84782.1 uncharacterized protein (TIGR02284 family) [Marinirhabdus gelatinilytica]